tara:strand:+ start:3452 stop:3670 length:219 start_codon:yes stop_codon:yes gene_type:complete
MPEFQGKKYPYTSAGYRDMMRDQKKSGAQNLRKGGKRKMKTGGLFHVDGYPTEPWVNKDGYPSGGISLKNKK